MKTYIRIESGIAAGTEHEITSIVTRIGSASNADICIPSSEIPSIALSIEDRGGVFRVYNRANRSIKIGDQPVEPGQVAIWATDQTIELFEGTRLSLVLNVKPVARETVEYEFDEFEEDETETGGDQQRRLKKPTNVKVFKQVLLLVVCGLVLLGLTIELPLSSDSSVVQSRFARICESAGHPESEIPHHILEKLRFAEASHIRGDRVMASLIFSSLYDELVAMKPAMLAKGGNGLELEILSFVEERKQNIE